MNHHVAFNVATSDKNKPYQNDQATKKEANNEEQVLVWPRRHSQFNFAKAEQYVSIQDVSTLSADMPHVIT